MAEPRRKPGSCQRAVTGIEVTVLELERWRTARGAERSEGAGREQLLAAQGIVDAVLELDLDRPLEAHARGSSEPEPAPARCGWPARTLATTAASFRISNVSTSPGWPLISSVRRHSASAPSCH